MGRTAVIVNGIAGVQYGDMLSDLDLQLSLNHDVQLLPLMGGQLDILMLRFRAVFGMHIQRFRDPVPEGSRQVVVHHVVGFLDALPLPPPGDGKGVQVGPGALDDFADVHAEGQRAPVQESEVQIAPPQLAVNVLLLGYAGLHGHLGDGVVFNLPQFPDPVRHFLNLEVQACGLLHGFASFIGQKNARPKDCFETGAVHTRGTTQIAVFL